MTDPENSLAEAQLDLSGALFHLWLQPLELTQAAFAAGTDLIAKAREVAASRAEHASPEAVEAAEEKIAHLDEEMDRAVPEAASVVV